MADIIEKETVTTEPTHTKEKHGLGMRAKKNAGNTAMYMFLVIMSVIWLIPFFFIVLESFRVESPGQVGYVFPHQWGFDNYTRLFSDTKFPKWFLNTLIIVSYVACLAILKLFLNGRCDFSTAKIPTSFGSKFLIL